MTDISMCVCVCVYMCAGTKGKARESLAHLFLFLSGANGSPYYFFFFLDTILLEFSFQEDYYELDLWHGWDGTGRLDPSFAYREADIPPLL